MAILDIQRRYLEIGRIRMGHQVEAKDKDGEAIMRAAKLDNWRLTSSNRQVLDEAAGLWGGEVREWEDSPSGGQWELYTATASLPIIVPPGPNPVSQFYEQWIRGGCTHRCDGSRNLITDSPCSCDPENRDCKVTTRISVVLPDLPGVGVWRLESHGWNAATELPGTLDLIVAAAERGRFLAGSLRIEQRTSTKGGKTRRLAVPVIDLDVTMRQLVSGGAETVPVQIPSVTPVPQDSPASTAEQIKSVENLPVRATRAAPVTSTGMKPRTAEEAANPDVITHEMRKRMFAIAREMGLEEDGVRGAVRRVTGQDSTSALTRDEYDQVVEILKAGKGQDDPLKHVTELSKAIQAEFDATFEEA